jgi:hypothetical protein
MLISHKHKFVIINIPKTGTNSYSKTLHLMNVIVDIQGTSYTEDRYYQHNTALDIKLKLKDDGYNLENYYSIVRTRNPWDRISSLYYWHKNNHDIFMNNDKRQTLDITQLKVFENSYALFEDNHNKKDWVLAALIENSLPQSTYFTDNNNNIIVNSIQYFEHIKQDFNNFCKRFSLPQHDLVHYNKSTNHDYSKLFYGHNDLIHRIAEKDKFVIDLQGYAF